MRVACPNCGTGIDSAAVSCFKCGAMFDGAVGWAPQRARGGVSGQAHGGDGVAGLLARLAGAAGLLAWLWCVGFAFLVAQNMYTFWRTFWLAFNLHLRHGLVPLALALFAVLAGAAILMLTRGRVVPRVALACGTLLITLAGPTLATHPLVLPVLVKAGWAEPPRPRPDFVSMIDGRWWDCTAIRREAVCAKDAAPAIARLDARQKALLDKLDALPAPPAALAQAQVLALFSAPPTHTDTLDAMTVLYWPGTAAGREAQGKISITILHGQLLEVRWEESERFFLRKIHPVTQDAPAAAR